MTDRHEKSLPPQHPIKGKLTMRQFFCLALWLPIALPLLLAIFSHVFSLGFPGYFRDANFVLLSPLLAGGIQYLFFIILVNRWSKNKTSRQIMRASWLLPVFFIPICLFPLGLGTLLFNPRTMDWQDWFFGGGSLSIACLVVGYTYFLLSWAIFWCLKWAGRMEEEESTDTL